MGQKPLFSLASETSSALSVWSHLVCPPQQFTLSGGKGPALSMKSCPGKQLVGSCHLTRDVVPLAHLFSCLQPFSLHCSLLSLGRESIWVIWAVCLWLNAKGGLGCLFF